MYKTMSREIRDKKYFNHFADRYHHTVIVNADNLRKMNGQAYKHKHTWIKMGKCG